MPVRIVINDLLEQNMGVDGGGRVEGVGSVTGRRNVCTSGFAVTNGRGQGIATAAHCPDELTYHDKDGTTTHTPLRGPGRACLPGRADQHRTGGAQPLFYADRGADSLRAVTTWRNRDSTRAGDFVCHYGESSGYSCAEVELTDYAPPGTLCGGPCCADLGDGTGPSCVPGDSGGPVFSGDVAFGIAKGINRTPSGQCKFYYYMSTEYLPPPWRLMTPAISLRRDEVAALLTGAGHGLGSVVAELHDVVLLIDVNDARLDRACFDVAQHGIAHDNHKIAGMDEMRRGAVDADYAAAALAGDNIGFDPCAVGDVDDRDLLALEQVRSLHQGPSSVTEPT